MSTSSTVRVLVMVTVPVQSQVGHTRIYQYQVPGTVRVLVMPVQYDRINRINIWYWSCIEICMYSVYGIVQVTRSISTVRVPVLVTILVPVLYKYQYRYWYLVLVPAGIFVYLPLHSTSTYNDCRAYQIPV